MVHHILQQKKFWEAVKENKFFGALSPKDCLAGFQQKSNALCFLANDVIGSTDLGTEQGSHRNITHSYTHTPHLQRLKKKSISSLKETTEAAICVRAHVWQVGPRFCPWLFQLKRLLSSRVEQRQLVTENRLIRHYQQKRTSLHSESTSEEQTFLLRISIWVWAMDHRSWPKGNKIAESPREARHRHSWRTHTKGRRGIFFEQKSTHHWQGISLSLLVFSPPKCLWERKKCTAHYTQIRPFGGYCRVYVPWTRSACGSAVACGNADSMD